MELLTEIGRGIYPPGSYLPSAERLSAEKGVSVSTVRRAVCLLNSIGAVKSSRPLGARVLTPSQSAENCDFTQPDLRRRLLELAESLQIFALSGKAVSEITLASLDDPSLCRWKQCLYDLKTRGHSERLIYTCLSLISEYAPFQTLRTFIRSCCVSSSGETRFRKCWRRSVRTVHPFFIALNVCLHVWNKEMSHVSPQHCNSFCCMICAESWRSWRNWVLRRQRIF